MPVVSKPYYHQQMYNQPPMQYGYRPMPVNNTIPPRTPIMPPPQPQMGYTPAPPPQQPINRPPIMNANKVVPSSNRSPIKKVYLQKTTKNKSFLDMHHYLKSIGIKNNAFMLTLIDPDLEGIDPYDPHLNAYYKQKVMHEVLCNYW